MSAIISQCGTYRYELTRQGELTAFLPPAVFLMLNPSTADGDQDDATIRRCRRFARSWGNCGLVVVNLYAFRATNPKRLWQVEDPVGPENDMHLVQAAAGAGGQIICAWGANARADRVQEVVTMLTAAGVSMWCLGTTDSGAPRHPLYIKSDQPLIEWKCP